MIESWIDGLMLAAPLLILVAAYLDTFMFTGYFLYGFAMLTSVGVMHMKGLITAPEIILIGWVGTALASCTNFAIGYLGGAAMKRQQERLMAGKLERLQPYLQGGRVWLAILVGRSITFTRPAYGFLLGAAHTKPLRFITLELIISLLWVVFWVCLILLGENIVLELL